MKFLRPIASKVKDATLVGRVTIPTKKSLTARFTKKYMNGVLSFLNGSFQTAMTTRKFALVVRTLNATAVVADSSRGAERPHGASGGMVALYLSRFMLTCLAVIVFSNFPCC